MNYGEKFIQFYNNELSNFKKELIKTIEQDYESDFIVDDLIIKYIREIQNQISDLEKKDYLKDKSSSLTSKSLNLLVTKKFKNNQTKNIVNNYILGNFDDYSKHSSYSNFSDFLNNLAKVYVRRNLINFISSNQSNFKKLFESNEISIFFIVKYNSEELNTLQTDNLIGNADNQKSSNKLISKQIELEDKEKSILLHIMLFHLRTNKKFSIPDTEFYRLLILCSSVFKEEDFYSIKTGNKHFDYFKHGFNLSSKFRGDKRLMLEYIIDKIEKLEGLKSTIQALRYFKNQDSSYLR